MADNAMEEDLRGPVNDVALGAQDRIGAPEERLARNAGLRNWRQEMDVENGALFADDDEIMGEIAFVYELGPGDARAIRSHIPPSKWDALEKYGHYSIGCMS